MFERTLCLLVVILVWPSLAAADDFEECKAPGLPSKATLDACGRAISSGKYRGAVLADLHFGRAFLIQQIGMIQGRNQKDVAGEMLPDINEAVRHDPNNGSWRGYRCSARASTGALGDALADCNDAVRVSKGAFNLAGAHNARARVYRLKGEHDAAISDYSRALQFDPQNGLAFYGRGCAKLAKKDTTGGNLDIAQAKKLLPGIEAAAGPC